MPADSPPSTSALTALRGLRSSPSLTGMQRRALRQELEERLARCRWFTVGVMAPTAPAAVRALRSLEATLGWDPLELDPGCALPRTLAGPVFLKGNQRSGRFLVRPEGGLGEGILITGHNPDDPSAEDTWGPVPLDLFPGANPSVPGGGTSAP